MGSIIPATHLIKVYIDILANLINNFIINLKYQAIIDISQNFILKVGTTQINRSKFFGSYLMESWRTQGPYFHVIFPKVPLLGMGINIPFKGLQYRLTDRGGSFVQPR
jgi:hypothetical protein